MGEIEKFNCIHGIIARSRPYRVEDLFAKCLFQSKLSVVLLSY